MAKSEEIKEEYIKAVGRRKRAVATLRLIKGSGDSTINGKPFHELVNNEFKEKILVTLVESLPKFLPFASIKIHFGLFMFSTFVFFFILFQFRVTFYFYFRFTICIFIFFRFRIS